MRRWVDKPRVIPSMVMNHDPVLRIKPYIAT